MNSQYAKLEKFIDSLGLHYFKGSEFTYYWDVVKNGVKNHIPDESLWPNIVKTLIVADRLRAITGSPLRITSSYRSPAYNAECPGASSGSFHKQFMALDLVPAKVSAEFLWSAARQLRGHTFTYPDGKTFVWHGGVGRYPTFCHIDCRGYDADWHG